MISALVLAVVLLAGSPATSGEQPASENQPPEQTELSSPGSQPDPLASPGVQPVESTPPTQYDPPLQEPSLARSGYHTHDGFYLRPFIFGLGYGRTSPSNTEKSDSYKGQLVNFSIALGWAITPRLVVFGEGRFAGIINAPVKENPNGEKEAEVTSYEAGLGLCYYMTLPPDTSYWPSLFVSGSSFIQKLTMKASTDAVTILSDIGYGFDVMFGGEKWVWDNWAVGAGARFSFASAKARHIDARWTTLAGALVLMMTYN
jgi:hypothetical protein